MTMMTPTLPTLRARVEPDTDPMHPRFEFDHASRMLTWHPRHNRLTEEHCPREDAQWEVNRKLKDGALVVKLYLYEHSGLTIRTTPFDDPWDSGCVGFAYLMPDKGRKEFGRYWRKRGRAAIEVEVRVLDQYLTGDVWGVIIETEDGEHVESCWGFYGHEYAEEEAARMLEDARQAQQQQGAA